MCSSATTTTTIFSPTIYDLCGEKATYILGFDIPEPHRGVRMAPGDERGFGALTVHAYGSTDEGVSFYVNFAGITLFHAGDLNLWHWRDESSITEIEAAERAFYDCVAPIPKQKIDVAFFPVDPRQGSMYDAGAGYFIMTVKPKFFIPMHFQGRPDVRCALPSPEKHRRPASSRWNSPATISICTCRKTKPPRRIRS